MASSVGSQESLYKGVKGVGRLDMYSPYRGCYQYSQGHEEDLDCREWGIPEGSREYLEGGGVRECPGERGPGGKQRQWWRHWVMPLKQALVINTSSASRAGGVLEAGETEIVGKRWRMSGSVMWLGSTKGWS
ncbi:hypothetical protein EDD17DRAFT_1514294 [Pisolithus thermaeus]|nr:hypothetical protein EV401DRAFT_1887049 [Pisolithus croceorrhizus]KAI6148216.1 hypothetical protein EDD17DRAFT_1514294 [Pisolithus thermaeus]